MTPEPLLAAPEMVPSLAAATLRMGAALVVLVAAAWAFLRWQRRLGKTRRHLQVLDRAALARGASVTLVEVEGRRLLLGVSSDGVRLLRDLEHSATPSSRPADFPQALREATSATEALK